LSRIIGLDYGDRTIGVAISDPANIMALGVETIRRERESVLRPSLRRLDELLEQYAPVSTIVIGYPKNMNNTEGERCAKTQKFKDRLAGRFPYVEIILWDERLSTAGARRSLSGYANEKSVIDEMAAVFILQGYIDFLRNQGKRSF
jgi:putative Holliday junction resolvase